MSDAREELVALRRMAELEDKAAGKAQNLQTTSDEKPEGSLLDSAYEWGKEKLNKAADVVSGLPDFVSKEGQKLIDSGGKINNKDISDYQSAVMSFAPLGMSKVLQPKTQPNIIELLGKKFGISTTLGEKTGSPITQGVETLQEKLPWVFGIGKFREKQSTQANNAAKKLLSMHIADPKSANVMEANRSYVSGLYDDLKGIVPGVEQQAINPEKTKYAAKEMLGRYPDLFKQLQDTKMEGILKNIVKDTADIVTPSMTSPIADHLGRKITTPATSKPMTATFDELWQLRSGLGDMIGQAKKKLQTGDVSAAQISQLNTLYKSVYSDIDNWATSIGKPEISKAIKTANQGYKDFVVKYDILQKAYDKAAGAEGTGKMFSPQRFSNELNRIILKDKSYGTFSKEEVSNMAGMANIMQAVKRAGQYMENPATGNRLVLPLLGSSAVSLAGGVPGAATAVSTTMLAKFLTTTDKGQKLAMSASNLNPNSKGMEKIIRAIAAEGWNLQDEVE